MGKSKIILLYRHGDRTLNAHETPATCRLQFMPNLSDEERRALQVLARHPEGCIDAALLADGFDVGMLAVLVVEGFADMKITPVEIRGRRAVWMRITERGRKAIAE